MEILQDLKSHVNSNLVQVIQKELHKCNQLYNTFKPIGLGVKEGIDTCMNIVDNYRKLKKSKKKILRDISIRFGTNSIIYMMQHDSLINDYN